MASPTSSKGADRQTRARTKATTIAQESWNAVTNLRPTNVCSVIRKMHCPTSIRTPSSSSEAGTKPRTAITATVAGGTHLWAASRGVRNTTIVGTRIIGTANAKQATEIAARCAGCWMVSHVPVASHSPTETSAVVA